MLIDFEFGIISPDNAITTLLGPGAWAPSLRETEAFVSENLVHVLETASSGLRVPKPSDGDEGSVEHSPDDVELVLKIGNSPRSDVHDDKVAEPVGGDAESDTLVTRAEGHDFGSVHPGDGQDTEGEDVEENEAESDEDPLRDEGINL